ncbi:tetratricopeptide repeat protein [Marinobacter zhejiangensis]|uniref:Tetratricopeptide repeat-containing protein n=1 Tax=Marinobacter zhejiangensis TaxID=488535 RepID=A0A1I4PYP5_9GAMM|nr:tetratricopeptide repeat protein [Marinobacter zhejiangensis]SFM32736.1 Tetratricopeptide repeat-containing protein [Marinobacter zhejiangensis]
MARNKQHKPPASHARSLRTNALISAILVTVMAIVATWFLLSENQAPEPTPAPDAAPSLTTPYFVGRDTCTGCHATEVENWTQSHHDLAMQPANENTVLGDFSGAEFHYNGITSKFYRGAQDFMVETDGPTGSLQDYPIHYTFGVFPLQQYLVELPGGRLQALNIAWDARPVDQGGQRWFHLYPDEALTYQDPLHWTGAQQNWNFMCAECHSTQVEKNYDSASRSYHTTWSEIDVSCEACHGPASNHLLWAKQEPGWQQVDSNSLGLTHRFDEREGVAWRVSEATGQPVRHPARTTETEIQVCAACHSRRAQLFEDDRTGQPLMDSFLPSLLTAGDYHADGQIDGEVYVYGSFIQSKMYQAGVTCSDCHNPHSLELRAPGNGVCLQCHSAPAYDSTQHHFHSMDGAGSQCVDCHMPAKEFMVVDPRRDHSFRIPRPDQTAAMGTPNACTGCHNDQTPQWAADQLVNWYGHPPRGYQQFAGALNAARTQAPDAEYQLLALVRDTQQPAIARATAVNALGNWLNQESLQAVAQALSDDSPLVRSSAVQTLQPLPAEQRLQLIRPLLDDPEKVVRALAAEALSDIPLSALPMTDRIALGNASEEYLESQQHNADTPSAHVNLGSFYAAQGKPSQAEASFREALALDPGWLPAYINLADFYRTQNRDRDGAQVLKEGLSRLPQSADLHHSMGLLQVRQRDLESALESLERAEQLAPDNARYVYVYAVALHSAGNTAQALAVVEGGINRLGNNLSLKELRRQLESSR